MGKKNAIKVRFNITLKSAFNLGAESDGKPYSIAWKRGSKSKNRGQTKKTEAKGGIVTFGETLTLVATMLQDEKSKKFDTKKLELTVKEDDKKPRDVGKLTVELGDYASAGKHGPFTLALDGDKKASKKSSKDSSRGSPSVKFDVESEWTHFNKKKITDKKKEGKEGVEIDGVEYGLETDNSDMSEDDATTLGDMSESESEIESEEEEDSDADEGMKEMSAPVKRNDDLKASSSSGSVPSKKALKEEKAKDKQIAKLEKEVSKLKDELTQAKDSMREKVMKATGSQQEVKQLKKELAEAKKQSGKGGGGGGSDDGELKKELDDAKKTIKDMQDDLRKKESELKLTSTSFRELKETQGKEGKDAESLRKELQEKEAELKEKNRLFLQLKDDFEALKKATDGGSNGKKGDETDKLKKEIESLRRELESAQKKSSAGASGFPSSGATAELEEELESTQKKLKKAKKEVEEKEKRIDELQLLVAKAGSSTSGAAESVEALKKQVDKQKTDIKALNKENRDSKDKIETLQQELDRAKSGGGGGAGGDAKELENLRKKLKSFEKEKEEDELIEREIYCMTTKYREGVHASAQNMCTILMQWGVLDDPPNERLLSKILNAIKKGYKVATDDNAALIKWLSFATNLHEQLENEVGTSEDENSGDIPENGIHIFRDKSGKSANEDDDDPVSIFFHNLETIIFEIYSAFLKNIYAHIDDVIVPAILQPIAGRDRRGPPQRGDTRGSKINGGKNKSNALPSTGLTNILGEHLELLHKYHIFDSVIKQFYCQVFYYINTRLFNNLLRQEELCSCGSGFQIKLGLSQLEEWISKADKNDKKHLSQAAKRYLLHITEAANVLVVDKDIFTDEEMIDNVFPTLTVPQIKYLLEHFQTDQYAPNPVPRNVMATLDGLSRQRKGQKVLEVDEAYLLSLPKDKKEAK